MLSALGPMPGEIDQLAPQLRAAYQGFHQAIAALLEPAINARLRSACSLPDGAKKTAVDEIRELLTFLGLAVQGPLSKQPAALYAIEPSPKNPHVQFSLRPKNSSGRNVTRVDLESFLPLEVCEAGHRVEGLAEWHRRVKGAPGRDSSPAR